MMDDMEDEIFQLNNKIDELKGKSMKQMIRFLNWRFNNEERKRIV